MRALLAATLFVVSMPVQAQGLYVHMGSKHLNDGDYNEINPGLGLELPVWADRVYIEAGFYENSFYERTDYVLLSMPLFGTKRGTWEAGVGTINVQGYDNIDNDKAHGPIPYFRYKAVRVMVMGPVLGVSARIATW